MVRIFYVTCPACGEEFHAHHGELRHTDVKLRCPRCEHRFLDAESPKLTE